MSSTFAVKLPSKMKPFLESEAREHGCRTVAEYLAVLATANSPSDDRRNAALEALLREGLASEPIVADAAFWKGLKRRARAAATRARRARA